MEMKLLTLPVYCDGFSNSKITPEDDIIKKWQYIRPFRNNLIHANISEENEWKVFIDDHCGFSHNIILQRNTAKNAKSLTPSRLYTHPGFFQKNDAIQTRITVEDIVSKIIEKMDKQEKKWIKLWLPEDSIPPKF